MKRKNGFTLLEVLISLLILGIGIMAVMQLFPASLRQARAAAERTQATTTATSEFNRLQGLSSPPQFHKWVKSVNTLHTLSEINAMYEAYGSLYEGLETNIEQIAGMPDTYRATFSVRMSDGRLETFTTYVARR